jgi:hypothetical protein
MASPDASTSWCSTLAMRPGGHPSIRPALLRDVLAEPGRVGVAALVGWIESLGLEWGRSDGN